MKYLLPLSIFMIGCSSVPRGPEISTYRMALENGNGENRSKQTSDLYKEWDKLKFEKEIEVLIVVPQSIAIIGDRND